MAHIKTGNELGTEVLKVLGIDPKMVAELSIHMSANEVATVTITRFLDKIEGDQLATVLERYALERKPTDPAAQAMETVARNLLKA